ncbi:MAG: hypothetical protein PHE89_03755 [Alphaproteobacteria bacterium]|nr:hypothetical protein [Alphaproteobacteria bacterium]
MTLWWLYAFIASFFLATYIYCNQVFKLPAPLLMIYRGLGVFLIMLPFAFSLAPSLGWHFYLLTAVNGLFIGYIDNRFFRSAKVFGAEATSVAQPLSLAVTFLAWFVAKPQQMFDLLANPFHFTIIFLSLFGICFSVIALRNGQTSKKALLYLLPCIIIAGLLDTNNKLIMDLGSSSPLVAVFYYTMFSGLFSGIYSLFKYVQKRRDLHEIYKLKNIQKGFAVIFFIIGLVVFKGYAMGLSPNPAYVVAIVYLAPIWISVINSGYALINKTKAYKKMNFKVTLLLVASVIALILAAS